MEYLIYGVTGVVAFWIFNFLRKLSIGKSMQRDIFQGEVNIGEIKWWDKKDGRFLLPIMYDEKSTILTLFTNTEMSEWSVAMLIDEEWVDITSTYNIRRDAREAAQELQEKGVLKVHYGMAQFEWNQAISEGS